MIARRWGCAALCDCTECAVTPSTGAAALGIAGAGGGDVAQWDTGRAVKKLRGRSTGPIPRTSRPASAPAFAVTAMRWGEGWQGSSDARFVRRGDGDRFLLDLAAANRAQLEAEGVTQVDVMGLCNQRDGLPALAPSQPRRHPIRRHRRPGVAVSVAENLASVRERITRAGRDPDEITIVAVTKGFGPEVCRSALDAGLKVLARTGSMKGWRRCRPSTPEFWHLIGHLQTNKVSNRSRALRDDPVGSTP